MAGRPQAIDSTQLFEAYYLRTELGKGFQEIGRKFGVDPSTVFRALNRLEISFTLAGKADYEAWLKDYKIPKRIPIRESEEFREWTRKIRLSGSLSALTQIAGMEKILNGESIPEFTCSPAAFNMEKAQEYISLWLAKHPDAKKLPQGKILTIRHFLQVAKGINIPRGLGKTYGLSGEKDSYGAYAHIKLSDEEIEKARMILKGIDLETLAFFDWGIETCARFEALAKTEISKIEQTGTFLTARVYESKTGKTWMKYLLTEKYPHARETVLEIQALMGKGWKYLFLRDDKKELTKVFAERMCKVLKETYKQLGKTDQYFYDKPMHTLRHIGAHLWLRRTKWDYGLVATIGGWDTIDTLRDCYGEMPPEVVQAKLEAL